MLSKYAKSCAMMIIALLVPLAANGISGTYTDPGGGTYWCNVYVSSVSSGKSYSWCTGDGETWAMDQFRGFECLNNGTVSTQNPIIVFKFRYNKSQSKDFKYNGSRQEIYVMLNGGALYQIAWAGSIFLQTDNTWGRCNAIWDGQWITVAFAPN